MFKMIIQRIRALHLISHRTFKNFGHKREPIPFPTTLWHGFLTFTFIGAALEWDVISKFVFGDQDFDEDLQKAMSIGKLDDS